MNRPAIALTTALMLMLFAPLTVTAQQARAQRPTTQAPAAADTQTINLNTATATQIATLPGIGPKTADLIVQYRQKNGPYKKIEEIMNVRGIGEKTFLKLKNRITVTPARPEGQ